MPKWMCCLQLSKNSVIAFLPRSENKSLRLMSHCLFICHIVRSLQGSIEMLTKNGSWRFFISFTLSHTADTSIVHFFLFDDDSFVPDYSSSRAFWHFFWIQFRLKLFLPSFFFPRITFIFFFMSYYYLHGVRSQWHWMFFVYEKRKFSSCSFAHCTFFCMFTLNTALHWGEKDKRIRNW